MASLLIAHGHAEARHYPVPILWKESLIVRRRLNRQMANEAMLLRIAVASVIDKKAGQEFKKRIKTLTEG